MTLVIAGYEHEKSIDLSEFSTEARPHIPKMHVNGIFAIADSAITRNEGSKTLLNGFRKVYEMEAKLWKPDFMPNGSFRDYYHTHESRKFFIGFAGSTLTAQHILNNISEHLGKLRISCAREDYSGPLTYKVIRHCQANPLIASKVTHWGDDTFTDRDFEGLLTGEVIADFVEYSINNALLSASRYKLSMNDFQEMQTDLVCGVWCPYAQRHELYQFRMKSRQGVDGLVAYTEKQLAKEGEVVVLGMRNKFEAAAQERFQSTLSCFASQADAMYNFLGECIEDVHNRGSKEIDKPISFRMLNRNNIVRRT